MENPVEPKYSGLPRRYEETQPALEQVYTHTNILKIGEKILEKYQQNSANDKAVALDQCQSSIWENAEQYKDNCVREALELAIKEEALRVKELEKIHKKNIKSENDRYEALMRQRCIEERYAERKDCENRMQQMAEELQRKHELEKLAEVKAARIEEQSIAESAAQEMSHRHDNAMKLYGEEMEEARKMEIAAMRYDLEDARIESVQKAREEEQDEANRLLGEAETFHQNQVDNLKATIQQLTEGKTQLESDLSFMTSERDNCIKQYKNVRKEFTTFIEHSRPDFSHGQADFLLPPK